jgi:hypothetical protein
LKEFQTPPIVPRCQQNTLPQQNDDVKSTSSSSSKQYPKENHALKIAYLNRASSNCPSEISEISLRKRRKRDLERRRKMEFLKPERSVQSGLSSTFSSKMGQSRMNDSK